MVGLLTDKMGSRAVPLVVELLINVGGLLVFRWFATTPASVAGLCFLLGWMTGG